MNSTLVWLIILVVIIIIILIIWAVSTRSTCPEKQKLNQPCQQTSDCNNGLICVKLIGGTTGVCKVAMGGVCATNSECATGLTCRNGICMATGGGLNSPCPCGEGFTCVNNVCKVKVGGTCTADSQCATGVCNNSSNTTSNSSSSTSGCNSGCNGTSNTSTSVTSSTTGICVVTDPALMELSQAYSCDECGLNSCECKMRYESSDSKYFYSSSSGRSDSRDKCHSNRKKHHKKEHHKKEHKNEHRKKHEKYPCEYTSSKSVTKPYISDSFSSDYTPCVTNSSNKSNTSKYESTKYDSTKSTKCSKSLRPTKSDSDLTSYTVTKTN